MKKWPIMKERAVIYVELFKIDREIAELNEWNQLIRDIDDRINKAEQVIAESQDYSELRAGEGFGLSFNKIDADGSRVRHEVEKDGKWSPYDFTLWIDPCDNGDGSISNKLMISINDRCEDEIGQFPLIKASLDTKVACLPTLAKIIKHKTESIGVGICLAAEPDEDEEDE